MTDIVVDMVSDLACPWCWLGLRRLDAAIAELPDLDVTVRFRPYELDANLPREGADYRAYMRAKFGPEDDAANRFKQMRMMLEAEGPALGIDFHFDRISRRPNTLDAHRVVRWAEGQGKGRAAKEALFQAFFRDGKDLCDRAVLADAAGAAGLDAALVTDLLDTDRDVTAVRREEAEVLGLGVQGVPTFVLDGRFAAVGAQSVDTLKKLLMKAAGSTATAVA